MKFCLYFLFFIFYFQLGALTISPKAVDDSVWVVGFYDDSLSQIDKNTNQTVNTTTFGDPSDFDAFPYGVCVDENYVWVTSSSTNNLERIEKSNINNITSQFTGTHPRGIAVDRQFIWVLASDDGQLMKIDKDTLQTLGTVSGLHNFSNHIVVDESHVWIANTNNHNVLKVDRITLEITTIIPPSEFTPNPYQIAVDDQFFYINSSDFVNDVFVRTIYKMDKSSHTLLNIVPVGTDVLESMTMDEDFIWITNSISDLVYRIDKETLTVTSINVGNSPYGIAMDKDFAWVVNRTDGNVSKISKSTFNITNTIPVGVNSVPSPISIGDMTGFMYDYFFSSIFESQTIKGKSKTDFPAQNAIDYDMSTYFRPLNKKEGKLAVTLSEELTVSRIKFYVNLLSADPVLLKWKIQYREDGQWKVINKDTATITQSQWLILGPHLDIPATKFRLKFKNKKINGKRGSFGIAEFAAFE